MLGRRDTCPIKPYNEAEDENNLPESHNFGSRTYASKDQQMVWGQPYPLFLEENKTQYIGTDIQALPAGMEIPTGVDHFLDRNSYHPKTVLRNNDMKIYIPTVEEHINTIVTRDPDHDNSVNKLKYNNKEITVNNKTTGKRLSQKRNEIPAFDSNSGADDKSGNNHSESGPLTGSTANSEGGQCMNTLTTIIKTENESDCSTVIIKVEPESKIIDDKALNDESHGSDKQVSSCHNNSKPSVQQTKGTSINCKGCERTFKIKSYYERHLKEGRCKQICQICGKEFKGRRDVRWRFNIHMSYHNKQKDHECKICGKMFILKAKMVEHVKSHTNPKPKICEKCGKGFSTTATLNDHVANVHVENRDKLFQCSKCPKMFLRSSSLRYHMRSTHDATVSFPCLTCNKTFKQKVHLKAHERMHSNRRDFKCEVCSAAFNRESSLYTHKKTHGKAYTHFCATCKKGFHEKRTLLEHENTHSGFKPYACSYCDYRCASKSNLPKHMKIHRKDTSNT